jgi:hypothetical protein
VDRELAKSTESEKLQSLESELKDNSNIRFTESEIRSKERIKNFRQKKRWIERKTGSIA